MTCDMDLKIISLMAILWPFAWCQLVPSCGLATDCKNCTIIRDCVWCRQPSFNGDRCMKRDEADRCSTQFVVDPQVLIQLIEDNPLAEAQKSEDPIQLRPQRVSMSNARKGQSYTIPVEFKQAKDYPIDLYFLMDLSNSMGDDKTQVEKLSSKLAATMRNITRYFSIGFGSFVDKNAFPYSWPEQKTYSFKNHMPIADNIQLFTNEVNRAEIVETYDEPEGGLEALVQATVCTSQIGWRAKARHIILMITDNYSHLAGNGKLGGILVPNDGSCHLNPDGRDYNFGLIHDYPSLGQISRLVREHSMNVIFAVTKDVAKPYQTFSPLVSGSSVGVLTSDSSNVVTLVEDQYKLITSSVELKDNATNGVKVRYFTNCLQPAGSPVQESASCGGLKVGSLIRYNISIEITQCPAGKSTHRQTIVVSPVGLTDSLIIDLDIECDQCPCERADNVSCPTSCKEITYCVEPGRIPPDEDADKIAFECSLLNVTKDDEFSPKLFPFRKCAIIDNSTGCRRDFVYGYTENDDKLVLYNNTICLPNIAIPVSKIAFMMMGALVAVGLALLLLWRLFLFMYDRKEYARFINESKNAKWTADNNPLYVEASVNYSNPAFQQGVAGRK
ncbi:integrin beta-PS [Daphnia magna]|uniref:integrin beta-PS n=1 Tax=Daphnia magna TaxID=35525 RepID=UPI001E1BCDCD|nr:integrin beta-PS [Daphnia magna]